MRKGLTKEFTVFAALVAASVLATPLVVGATRALAVSEPDQAVTTTVAVAPVEVAPVAVAPAEGCGRKVRVVYGGYAAPAACAAPVR